VVTRSTTINVGFDLEQINNNPGENFIDMSGIKTSVDFRIDIMD